MTNAMAVMMPPLPTDEAIHAPGWHVDGSHGHMQDLDPESGKPIRYVRLAEIVKWIRSQSGVPLLMAITEFCRLAPANLAEVCRIVRPGDYPYTPSADLTTLNDAVRQKMVSPFGKVAEYLERERHITADQLADYFLALSIGEQVDIFNRFIKSCRDSLLFHFYLHTPPREVTKGQEYALFVSFCWLPQGRHVSASELDRKDRFIDFLSVPITYAHQHWGYGVEEKPLEQEQKPSAPLLQLVPPVSPDDEVKRKYLDLVERYKKAKNNSGFRWAQLGDDVALIVLNEQKRRSEAGEPDSVAVLARDFGCTRQTLEHVINRKNGQSREKLRENKRAL